MIDNIEFDNLYSELLNNFSNKRTVNPTKLYSLIYPCIGNKFYKTGLAICGRATNGYYNKWTIPQISKNKAKIIKDSKIDSDTNWDTDQIQNFCATKPFFRIIRILLLSYYQVDPNNYSEYFTWTNLMKIAPANGGNPSNSEFNAQVAVCKRILKYEIDYYKPKNLLIMSGKITVNNYWDYDFLEELKITPKEGSSEQIIEGVYNYTQVSHSFFCRFNGLNFKELPLYKLLLSV